jgi:DNA-directed RNA polymerase subunit RPC12/RpoP
MKWPSWLTLTRTRKPPPPASPTACPTCGGKMIFVEKYTMMGDDQRTYRCNRCRKEHTINFGTAMWKLMSDANNQAIAEYRAALKLDPNDEDAQAGLKRMGLL